MADLPDLPGVLKQPTVNEQTSFYHVGDGLHYLLEEFNGSHALLRCLNFSCPGTALWQEGSLTLLHPHDHLPNPLFPAQLQLRKQILQRVDSGDQASYRNIFEEESSLFSRAVQAKIKWELIYPEMKAARLSLPPPAESLQEVAAVLQLPQFSYLSATLDGQDSIFSKLVTSDDQSSSLVLCSSRNISFLSRVRSLLCITENVSNPKLQCRLQLLVLVGMYQDYALPLVYCLMENQNQASYKAVLMHLRGINTCFDPDVIVCPYDSELKQALNSVFPRAETLNRLHHQFVKDLIQFISSLPIIIKDFKRVFALCCAVPLVPHAFMHEAFKFVNEEAMQEDYFEEILPLFDYVWQTWLTGPLYDEEAVSVSMDELCSSNVSVITNMMEKVKIKSCPNMYFLIGSIAELEEIIDADIQQLIEGRRISPARKIETLHSKRLLQDLQDRTISTEQFLTEILPSITEILNTFF